MPETNADRARRGYEAVLRDDMETVREFLAPDVRWHGGDPDATGACRNRDEALAFMRQARQRRRIGEVMEVFDAGDKVVVIMRPATPGRRRPVFSANLTTFRDGRAVEMVHYADPAEALAAAGLPRKLWQRPTGDETD